MQTEADISKEILPTNKVNSKERVFDHIFIIGKDNPGKTNNNQLYKRD